MRIVFMGTPQFAVASLEALVQSGHEVVGVVSQPDKPKGRGHKMAFPPVKEYALSQDIQVYQPETLRDNAFLPVLQELYPDLIVVVAYGKMLPQYILDYPKHGCINVHASLLPKYRGAAPIQKCIMEGETETGITTMYMEKGMDTGDMLERCVTSIDTNETASSLHDRLAKMGAELLISTIKAIETGEITREKQDDSKSCYAPMIDKKTALIDWQHSAESINNLIRSMNAWPLAYTYYNDKMMKIASAKVLENHTNAQPGQVMGYSKGEGLSIACGEGAIRVLEVQFEGKRMMNIDDYMQGHNVETGTILGTDIQYLIVKGMK